MSARWPLHVVGIQPSVLCPSDAGPRPLDGRRIETTGRQLLNRFHGHTEACCGCGLGFSATFFFTGDFAAGLVSAAFTNGIGVGGNGCRCGRRPGTGARLLGPRGNEPASALECVDRLGLSRLLARACGQDLPLRPLGIEIAVQGEGSQDQPAGNEEPGQKQFSQRHCPLPRRVQTGSRSPRGARNAANVEFVRRAVNVVSRRLRLPGTDGSLRPRNVHSRASWKRAWAPASARVTIVLAAERPVADVIPPEGGTQSTGQA